MKQKNKMNPNKVFPPAVNEIFPPEVEESPAFRRLWHRYLQLELSTEKYYDYIYVMISIGMVFFASLCAFSIIYHKEPVLIFAIYRFILPFSLYIFGVMYTHNLCALTKSRAYGIKLETRLRQLSIKYQDNIDGWITFSKRSEYNSSLIFSYGTVFLFFLIIPYASFLFSELFAYSVKLPLIYSFWFPFLCWALYFFSLIQNIVSVIHYRRKIDMYLIRAERKFASIR